MAEEPIRRIASDLAESVVEIGTSKRVCVCQQQKSRAVVDRLIGHRASESTAGKRAARIGACAAVAKSRCARAGPKALGEILASGLARPNRRRPWSVHEREARWIRSE